MPDETGSAAPTQTDAAAKVTGPITPNQAMDVLAARQQAKAKSAEAPAKKEEGKKEKSEAITPENRDKKKVTESEEEKGKDDSRPAPKEEAEETEEAEEKPEAEEEEAEESGEEAAEGEEAEEEDAEDQDEDPTVDVPVNGKVKSVPLSDLIKAYSKAEGADEKFRVASDLNKNATEKNAETLKFHREAETELVNLGKALLSQLTTDKRYSKESMEEIRLSDPSEWNARRAEIADKQALIDRTNLINKNQKERDAAQAQANFKQYVTQQVADLQGRFPEFKDKAKGKDTYTKAITEASAYLATKGFSPEEINNTARASMWEIVIKAMRYDVAKGKVADTAKQVQKAPKMLKPGAKKQRLSETGGLEKSITDMQAELKKTGNPDLGVKIYNAKQKLKATRSK